MEFEWDAEKWHVNAAMHGVSFEEASMVFGDALPVLLSLSHEQRAEHEAIVPFPSCGPPQPTRNSRLRMPTGRHDAQETRHQRSILLPILRVLGGAEAGMSAAPGGAGRSLQHRCESFRDRALVFRSAQKAQLDAPGLPPQ